MNLTDYSDLSQLLSLRPATRETNRAFGLDHRNHSPLDQLLAWRDTHRRVLDRSRSDDVLARYQYQIGLVMGTVAFVVGIFSGAALLNYSGKEPVNVVYFLTMAVVIPLMTMGLALLSMARADKAHNTLVHLSPASWMRTI